MLIWILYIFWEVCCKLWSLVLVNFELRLLLFTFNCDKYCSRFIQFRQTEWILTECAITWIQMKSCNYDSLWQFRHSFQFWHKLVIPIDLTNLYKLEYFHKVEVFYKLIQARNLLSKNSDETWIINPTSTWIPIPTDPCVQFR